MTENDAETTHEHCDECGFDGAAFGDAALLDELRALGPRWGALLAAAGPELSKRPAPEVWSAIEYAAHSRDITALHAFGVGQALTIDEPVFPAIAADELIESAVAAYAELDPDAVAAELETQASLLAQLADEAGRRTWERGLTIGDSRSDVRGMLEHALHDSQHHLADVERGLTTLRG